MMDMWSIATDACFLYRSEWFFFIQKPSPLRGQANVKLEGLKARRTCEPPEPAGLAADQRRRGGGGANQQPASTVGRGGWDPGRPG